MLQEIWDTVNATKINPGKLQKIKQTERIR